MNNKLIVSLMTKLINKKYYKNVEDVQEKLDVYFAVNRLTEEEYAELILLANEVYNITESSNKEEE